MPFIQRSGVRMRRSSVSHLYCVYVLLLSTASGLAQAQADIVVTKARIGCLDIQTEGNLTGLVAKACNNRGNCSYKAPTPDEYRRAGVQAHTRTFCTQG